MLCLHSVYCETYETDADNTMQCVHYSQIINRNY